MKEKHATARQSFFGGLPRFFTEDTKMEFTVVDKRGTHTLAVEIRHLMMVGFSGATIEKAMEHVGELERLRVQCPAIIPAMYPGDPAQITQAAEIEVAGEKTSGEAEYLILKHDGKYYIGLGSDHTDRESEQEDISASKRECPKPCAAVLWDYYEVKDHLDKIRLASSVTVGGREIEYQSGTMADILAPISLLGKVSREEELEDCLIFSGTLPLLRGYRYGERFSCRLVDDLLGREIDLSYAVKVAK